MAEQIVRIPPTKGNIRRVKRALAIALAKEGRRVPLKEGYQVLQGQDGQQYLLLATPYARVTRLARRILLRDWQAGRLEGVEPMRYPAILYQRYYVEDGTLGWMCAYLHPDGSVTRYGTCGVQYRNVSCPSGGRGAYVDTRWGEQPPALAELEV